MTHCTQIYYDDMTHKLLSTNLNQLSDGKTAFAFNMEFYSKMILNNWFS